MWSILPATYIHMYICRRDTIVTRGDSQSKMKQKVVTKGTFERQMAEHRRKIKQTINVSCVFVTIF